MKGLFCALGGTPKDLEEIVRLRNSVKKLISKLESNQTNNQEESS